MVFSKLSASSLQKLPAPFSLFTYTHTRIVSKPFDFPVINPSSIFQNPTKTLHFAKHFSAQSGSANEAQVESGRVSGLRRQSHGDLAGKPQIPSKSNSKESPEEAFIKANIKVLFRWTPVKSAVVAGVFRDPLGEFRGAFSERIRNASCSSVAEYRAVAKCIELAIKRGYPKVVIESANKEVCDTIMRYVKMEDVSMLLRGPGPDHFEKPSRKEKRECLAGIMSLLPRGGSYCRVVHGCQEGNELADYFAKRGASEGGGLKEFESLPLDM